MSCAEMPVCAPPDGGYFKGTGRTDGASRWMIRNVPPTRPWLWPWHNNDMSESGWNGAAPPGHTEPAGRCSPALGKVSRPLHPSVVPVALLMYAWTCGLHLCSTEHVQPDHWVFRHPLDGDDAGPRREMQTAADETADHQQEGWHHAEPQHVCCKHPHRLGGEPRYRWTTRQTQPWGRYPISRRWSARIYRMSSIAGWQGLCHSGHGHWKSERLTGRDLERKPESSMPKRHCRASSKILHACEGQFRSALHSRKTTALSSGGTSPRGEKEGMEPRPRWMARRALR